MPDIVIVLDNIRSAYNVGAIARTCDGLGVKNILTYGITPHLKQPSDERLPHVIARAAREIEKTALGGEDLLSTHHGTLDELMDDISGRAIVCLEQTSASQELATFTPTGDLALILGNEVNGVSQELLRASNIHLEIPMLGIKESLNVASAGAIAIYDLASKFAKLKP